MIADLGKLWQVLGRGEGFVRNGKCSSVELSGHVLAADPNGAWNKAVALARVQSPEISQIDAQSVPRAVLNCDEIEDASGLKAAHDAIDRVELSWSEHER